MRVLEYKIGLPNVRLSSLSEHKESEIESLPESWCTRNRYGTRSTCLEKMRLSTKTVFLILRNVSITIKFSKRIILFDHILFTHIHTRVTNIECYVKTVRWLYQVNISSCMESSVRNYSGPRLGRLIFRHITLLRG